LAEGCREIAARVVPPNKNAVGRPPIGDLVEPQLAAKGLEVPALVVVCAMVNGGPASPCREPGKPNGWRLAVLSLSGHQNREITEKTIFFIAWRAQRPRPRNHFGAYRWVVSVVARRGSRMVGGVAVVVVEEEKIKCSVCAESEAAKPLWSLLVGSELEFKPRGVRPISSLLLKLLC
jgi:hypothetical protein